MAVADTPPTLYLIDAFAQLFRAYHAIRNGMRSRVTSEPTHAVYGFCHMFFKLYETYQPAYIAVALDAPGRTFRDDLFDDYKGTRSPTPEDFTTQVPRAFELLECLNIPVFAVPGLEADDVIATIVHRVLADPAHPDVRVRIVSKDKDFEQLLGPRVEMFDVHTDTLIDVAALRANKGIRPDQVIDYLSLLGDTVDNVPGVPGVGSKTAAELLQQYDSIAGIYAHIEELKGKRKENFLAAREKVPLSQTLVTLKSDADFPFALSDVARKPFHLERLLTLFKQLDFNRLQEDALRMAGQAPTEPQGSGGATATSSGSLPPPPDTAGTRGVYRCITTLEELREVAAEMRAAEIVAVDTETTGLRSDSHLCGLCISWKAGTGVYIPVRSPEPARHLDIDTVLNELRPLLEDPGIPKAGHNLKFDARILLGCNVGLRGVTFDTMHASTLIDPKLDSARLDNLAQSVLAYEMIHIDQLIGARGAEHRTFDHVDLETATQYAAEDADIVLRLRAALMPRLTEMSMIPLVCEVESPLGIAIARMEYNGILCDPDELLRQGDVLTRRIGELRQQIYEVAGVSFDLNSTQQLAEILFVRNKLKAGKKGKSGGYSTDEEVLSRLAREEDIDRPYTALPRLMLEYRGANKLVSTYLGNLRESIQADGRIHTTFHQLHTATGRLASHGPNLQNIPVREEIGRQVRAAFKAPPGSLLLCADYSQIELRILAHLSGDTALKEAFISGKDIHAAVAAEVFGVPIGEVTRQQRDGAKTINFGIIYGVTAFGLARRIPGLNSEAASALIESYKRRFPGIDAFLQACIDKALADGYVETILHRRRAIPEINSRQFHTRSLGERLAINTVVQGSAADLIKVAMVQTDDRAQQDRLPLKSLLQIHDELVFETPAEAATEMSAIVRAEMENAMSLHVPLVVEIGVGPDWLSAK